MSRTFYFVGHRGTRVGYDENTMEAFQQAIKKGANVIEFDVRKTKDQKLVIFHDASLERITTCSGKIEQIKYNQIKDCRTKKRNRKIPLLRDVLEEFFPRVKLMIELKGKNVKKNIFGQIKKYNNIQNCIFSGRQLGDLISIQQRFPESQICYNITKGKDLTISEFLQLGNTKELKEKPDMISLRSSLVTKDFIHICHKNKIKALSWDFFNYSREKATNRIKDLIKIGIDGILFDDYKNIPVIKEWIANHI
ncbi:MAG: glycerophosphodiester phosphodiesterase family protein [Promethearchaeia archaeon]